MRAAPPSPSITLGRRQLYMLPTRLGLLFTVAIAAMLMAAVNYNNGLAYMFTFLLGSMATVSMLYTHRNLSGLRLTPGPCAPVFSGQEASFGIWLHNDSRRPRLGVRIVQHRREIACIDLAPHQSQRVDLPAPSRSRGYLPMPPFVLTSHFPLGLLFTWSRELALAHRCVVYPRPGSPRPMTITPDRRRYQELGQLPEGDDFIGLREYRRGDSPKHVHWKAVARGQGMYTKQFGGAGQDTVWLDWATLPGMDTEGRLRQLCRWVLDAERAGLRYGLRLPGKTYPPDHSDRHRHSCLAALALFGRRPPSTVYRSPT